MANASLTAAVVVEVLNDNATLKAWVKHDAEALLRPAFQRNVISQDVRLQDVKVKDQIWTEAHRLWLVANA